MDTISSPETDRASERLAGELADVEAAIELVASGVASRITITGLRFGRVLADNLSAGASEAGIALEASFWPEDDVCDVEVSRADA